MPSVVATNGVTPSVVATITERVKVVNINFSDKTQKGQYGSFLSKS